MGLYLWDIQYIKEGATWYLRILIDTEEGITISQCEDFNRAIGDKLDEIDLIKQSYMLEVSSPGIDRHLTQDWHFEKLVEKEVEINFIRPIDGQKVFVGKLVSKQGDEIKVLIDEDTEMCFSQKEAAWVRLYVEF